MKKSIVKYLLVILFANLLIKSESFAQDNIFKVYLVNGNVQLQGKTDSNPKPLLVGKEIYPGSTIITSENSYLCLQNQNGYMMEISKAGKFKIDDLSKKAKKVNYNVAKKYFEFLLESIKETSGKRTSFSLSTERSFFDTQRIATFLPKNCNVMGKSIKFSWFPEKNAEEYTFILKNNFSEEITAIKTKDTTLNLDLNTLKIQKPGFYHWCVTTNTGGKIRMSDEPYIFIIDNNSENMINADIESIKSSVDDDNSIIGGLLIAQYFERKNLMQEAYNHYFRLLRYTKNLPAINNAYMNFLVKLSGKQ
jgi:hypothetical protein